MSGGMTPTTGVTCGAGGARCEKRGVAALSAECERGVRKTSRVWRMGEGPAQGSTPKGQRASRSVWAPTARLAPPRAQPLGNMQRRARGARQEAGKSSWHSSQAGPPPFLPQPWRSPRAGAWRGSRAGGRRRAPRCAPGPAPRAPRAAPWPRRPAGRSAAQPIINQGGHRLGGLERRPGPGCGCSETRAGLCARTERPELFMHRAEFPAQRPRLPAWLRALPP